MNKRIKRKIEKRRREKVLQVLDLALQVNGLNERSQKKTGNLPTVFFYFAGHVANIEIDIHKNGWNSMESNLYDSYKFYTDDRQFDENVRDISGNLKSILNSTKI